MKENKQEMSMQEINESSFIYRIKSFFKKLFFKEKAIEQPIEQIQNIVEEDKTNIKSEFMKDIKVETNDKLIAIQKKLESGAMEISELEDEQKDKLIELYDKQIAMKKEKLANIKQKILNIRKCIVEG